MPRTALRLRRHALRARWRSRIHPPTPHARTANSYANYGCGQPVQAILDTLFDGLQRLEVRADAAARRRALLLQTAVPALNSV